MDIYFNDNDVSSAIELDSVEQFNYLSADEQRQKLLDGKKQLKLSASAAGLFLVLFWAIIYFSSSLIQFVIKLATGGSHTLGSIASKYGFDLIRWLYNDLIQLFSLILSLIIVNKIFNKRLHQIAKKPPKQIKANVFFIPLAIGTGYVANFISSILISVLKSLGATLDSGEITVGDISTTTLIMTFFAFCIFAPVVEEFIFRGCILNLLLPFGEKTAILCSAFFFGIFHGNLGQGIGAFVIGIFLGIAAMKTGSIYLGIFIHFLNNFISYILTISKAAGKADDSPIFVLISLVVIGFIISAIIILVKKHRCLAISNSGTQTDFIPKKHNYLLTNVFILLSISIHIAIIIMGIK